MKKIKVGLDFDGVIVYNPFRIVRAPITFFKRNVLKTKPKFWIPQSYLQKFVWTMMHKTSIFPALGIDVLKTMANNPKYEFHLVSGRYSFLANDLVFWLANQKIKHLFKSINLNIKDAQPNLFKREVLEKLELDYFVEDNLDIVDFLVNHTKTKIFWVSNIFDWRHHYVYKYPHLKQALEALP